MGARTFAGCASLTQLTLPDAITALGTGIFSGSGITSVDFSAGMKELHDSTVEGCTKLGSITLPDSLEAISAKAFSECTLLNQIVMPNSVERIDSEAFVAYPI